MISMPAAYKQAMDAKYRNQSYMLVTIGIINQVAQKDCLLYTSDAADEL